MRLASPVFVSFATLFAAVVSFNCSSSDSSSSSSSSSGTSGDSGTSGSSSGTSGTSGTSGSSGCDDYSPPAGFDSTTPAVSFTTDVMPIFGQSCAFSVCHGNSTGTNNGVFLGLDAPTVYAAIVGKIGDENATMPYVTAGDPRNSYLMRKMDASQCAVDAQCSGGSCQDSMPQGLGSLPIDTRDTVRRWIAQGAKND